MRTTTFIRDRDGNPSGVITIDQPEIAVTVDFPGRANLGSAQHFRTLGDVRRWARGLTDDLTIPNYALAAVEDTEDQDPRLRALKRLASRLHGMLAIRAPGGTTTNFPLSFDEVDMLQRLLHEAECATGDPPK